jgi:DNA-binding SARP family transcriptional activator
LFRDIAKRSGESKMTTPSPVGDNRSPLQLAPSPHELAGRHSEDSWNLRARQLLDHAQRVAADLVCAGSGGAEPDHAYRITQFGRFQISRNGASIASCRSKRAICVLRYLLSTERLSASKWEIASLIWPNSPSERAYHSLHVTIGALRSYLDFGPQPAIVYADDRYNLNDAIQFVDDTSRFTFLIERGDASLQAGDLEQAAALFDMAIVLYIGDYDLAGIDYEWAVAEQRRHADALIHALHRAGSIAFTTRRFEQAVALFHQLLRRDPYREDVLAQLMIALGQLGRRGDAARAYARSAQLLMTDLGVTPSTEVRDVYRDLLGRDPAA